MGSESMKLLETVDYASGSSKPVSMALRDETLWVTQKQMCDLFSVSTSTISEHVVNIFESGELSREATIRKFRTVQNEGSRDVERKLDHYNLDVVISVGYRVNSQAATQFRIWATGILKQYVVDGFVINEQRLREEPSALNKLAAKIRELRASETNIYASVRECFKLAASDYSPSSAEVKTFYALLQDKFHHAVTGMTSSKLIMDRASHVEPNMGLVSMKGVHPSIADAKIGKNYLTSDELYRLHLLSEQFLLYAESTALAGREMTMRGLHDQLDALLSLNGYPVFGGYEDFLKQRAQTHAEQEHRVFIEILQLTAMLEQEIDLESYYDGDYASVMDEARKFTNQKLRKLIESKSIEALPDPA